MTDDPAAGSGFLEHGPLGGSTEAAAIIDAALVRRLLDQQFPQWSDLPVTPVLPGGWDNRTFRLGSDLSVRLPTGDWYALQVAKEQRWLPWLAPQLPLPIPTPVAEGRPGLGYAHPWSVYRWMPGVAASSAAISSQTDFASSLGRFLTALQAVDATGGPGPGEHNFHRGGPLDFYAAEAVAAIEALGAEIDGSTVSRLFHRALDSSWRGDPVWFHGDVAEGNLLLREGQLAAVIDFGTCGVGDPACDTVIAWTLLSRAGRRTFRASMPLDPGTWLRGKGWALWKASITLRGALEAGDRSAADVSRRVIGEVLRDEEE